MKYWILQSESEKFRLTEWLQDFKWLSDDQLIDRWHIDASNEEREPGDSIFVWNKDRPETTGIIAQGKIVPLPDKFPLAEHEPDYFIDSQEQKGSAERPCIAVKYNRFCPGNPITKRELEFDQVLREIIPFIEQRGQITEITDRAGKLIEWRLKSRTTMIDLTYCQT